MNDNNQKLLEGFNCIARADARILILGSMPGQISLTKEQYYAHPRNSFWRIMAEMFGFNPELPYEKRLPLIQQQGIALWDVVHRCKRKGSLDADIKQQTVEANNFQQLFNDCPDIHHVFFNGQKAASLYKTHVLPGLEPNTSLHYQTLPSTSPAHASLGHDQKYQQWLCIKERL